MDSCSESRRVSEESETMRSFINQENNSSKRINAEPKKSGGHESVSPDGTAWLVDDDEHASPQVRARSERRPLLSSEDTQRALPETKTPVASERSSSLRALPQNDAPPASAQAPDHSLPHSRAKYQPRKAEQRVTAEQKNCRDSCATSSLVSESVEHNDFSLTAKKSLPGRNGPDSRKREPHQLSNGAYRSSTNSNPAAPSRRPRDGQPTLSDSQAAHPLSQENSKQTVPPRSSSLAGTTSLQATPNPVSAQAAKNPPGIIPPRKEKMPATADELREMKSMLRKRAMSNYEGEEGVCRFEILFNDERYAHIDGKSKSEALMGHVNPVYSRNTSDRDQQLYYQEVSRLYVSNYGKAGASRLAEKENQLDQFDTREEKENFRNGVLDNLIWKLTPNQRHGLREKFEGLYGNSVLRDDTNWMFFDTIIRSHEMDEAAQRELMKDIFSASRETRLQQRDRLRDKIHKYLTRAQRDNLKRVCKERHDSVLYSRLPLFHVIIREKNIQAMKDYLDAVYLFVPRKRHYSLISSRCIGKEQEKGDGSFFSMVQWGTIEMMTTFHLYILLSERLTFEERFFILSSYRHDDRISAFNMIMGAGDYQRAKAFLNTITIYFDDTTDYFGAFLEDIPKRHWKSDKYPRPKTEYDLCTQLLLGFKWDRTRFVGKINAYTRAIEHGHKECAKRFSNLIKPMWRYFKCHDRDAIRSYYYIDYDVDGGELPEAVRKMEAGAKRVREGNAKFRLKMSPEERQEKDEAWKIWWGGVLGQNARDAEILAERKKAIEEGRPISADKTVPEQTLEQRAINDAPPLKKHAYLAYLERDLDVARDTRKALRKQKRKENPTPLQSAAKRLSSSFKANRPDTSPAPEKRQKSRMPTHNSPSIYIKYNMEKNPDGSPKPHTGDWPGEYKEPKKRKKPKQKAPSASDLLGYREVGEQSEGG